MSKPRRSKVVKPYTPEQLRPKVVGKITYAIRLVLRDQAYPDDTMRFDSQADAIRNLSHFTSGHGYDWYANAYKGNRAPRNAWCIIRVPPKKKNILGEVAP